MFVWGKPRGENFLDTGAHFYDTYKTLDGKYLAIGAIEPNFYAALLKGLDMTPGTFWGTFINGITLRGSRTFFFHSPTPGD